MIYLYKIEGGLIIQKHELIKILENYRMNDKNIDPYLYENKNVLGLYYSIYDAIFGLITRVKLLETVKEAEQFILKLWWYKKNYQEKRLHIELTSENEFSDFSIILENRVLQESDFITDVLNDKKKQSKKYSSLVHSSTILLEVAKIKIQLQHETIHTLNTYYQQINTIIEEIKKVKKYNQELESFTILPFDQSLADRYQILLQDFNQYMNKFLGIENISTFMRLVWELIYQIETNANYLHNKYMTVKSPLMAQDLREFFKGLNKGRFTLFKRKNENKENIYTESSKIVAFEQFNENEQKRIKDKFSMINQLDFTTLGEYLMEFDNLAINISEDNREYQEIDVLNQLIEDYSNLKEEQRDALMLFHSILNPVFTIIMKPDYDGLLNREEIIQLDGIRNIINHIDNVFIKLKYFKNIDLSSNEGLLNSIKKYENILQEINFNFEGEMQIFVKGPEKIDNEPWINCAFLAIQAPSIHKNCDVLHVIKLNSTCHCIYLPIEINCSPYEEEHILKVILNKQAVALKNDNNWINMLKYNIIKVNKYKPIRKKNDCIITDMVKIGENVFKYYQ